VLNVIPWYAFYKITKLLFSLYGCDLTRSASVLNCLHWRVQAMYSVILRNIEYINWLSVTCRLRCIFHLPVGFMSCLVLFSFHSHAFVTNRVLWCRQVRIMYRRVWVGEWGRASRFLLSNSCFEGWGRGGWIHVVMPHSVSFPNPMSLTLFKFLQNTWLGSWLGKCCSTCNKVGSVKISIYSLKNLT
jgi:hypothetical protein